MFTKPVEATDHPIIIRQTTHKRDSFSAHFHALTQETKSSTSGTTLTLGARDSIRPHVEAVADVASRHDLALDRLLRNAANTHTQQVSSFLHTQHTLCALNATHTLHSLPWQLVATLQTQS